MGRKAKARKERKLRVVKVESEEELLVYALLQYLMEPLVEGGGEVNLVEKDGDIITLDNGYCSLENPSPPLGGRKGGFPSKLLGES